MRLSRNPCTGENMGPSVSSPPMSDTNPRSTDAGSRPISSSCIMISFDRTLQNPPRSRADIASHYSCAPMTSRRFSPERSVAGGQYGSTPHPKRQMPCGMSGECAEDLHEGDQKGSSVILASSSGTCSPWLEIGSSLYGAIIAPLVSTEAPEFDLG